MLVWLRCDWRHPAFILLSWRAVCGGVAAGECVGRGQTPLGYACRLW